MKKPNTEKLYDVEEEHYDILHYMVDVKSKEFGSLDKGTTEEYVEKVFGHWWGM